MFVPIHHLHHRAKGGGGRNPQLNPKAVAGVAALAAAGGIVTAITKEATHGDRAAGAIIIVAVAAIAGFLFARGIGKQGKI
jgi:hypothetical protein